MNKYPWTMYAHHTIHHEVLHTASSNKHNLRKTASIRRGQRVHPLETQIRKPNKKSAHAKAVQRNVWQFEMLREKDLE